MKFRELRRKDREITEEAARQLFREGECGVLSTVDQDGQPYGVPLSYVYRDQCIYFHCALIGHKLDNMVTNPRVSFCVVGKTKILPDKFATEYESAIVFGRATEVLGAERENALLWLLEKYSPEDQEEGKSYIEQQGRATKVLKITIDHVSGKARR
jgi:uncharacterized protein